jgi:predicted nuclease with TOPRIM domain
VADEMSPGEIRRTLERMDRAQHDSQRAVDDRITKLATEMVPTSLWSAEHKALMDDVRHLADDWREATDRIERTSQERMATLRTEISGVRGEVAAVRKAQDQHAKAHESDRSWSRSKTLTVIAIVVGAAATLVGAYIAAFAAAGGVR